MDRTAGDPASDDRNELLHQLEDWLDTPMLALAVLWLGLFVYEVLYGRNPVLEVIGVVIWALFILEVVLGVVLASSKADYLKGNWLKVLSLLAPGLRALRFFAVFRAAGLARLGATARASRGLRLLRVVSSTNRTMTAFGRSMGRRHAGYALAVTAAVVLVGAAGMLAFERPAIPSYGSALWWTAMIMTTLGSDFWPRTAEGRVLCVLLSLYAISVFGYFTAALATFFVGRDAEDDAGEIAGHRAIAGLRAEIQALRRDLNRGGASPE